MQNFRTGLAIAASAAFLGATSMASASPFTTTSPTGGPLPSGVTPVGGIVLDLTGANGTRVVSELAADQLYVGYAPVDSSGNYESTFTVGTQTGFTAADVAALGGGLSAASVRVSLYDGDSGVNDPDYYSGTYPNDFDAYADTLSLNGNAVGADSGNFSSVVTQNTDGTGNEDVGGMGQGFRNNLLDTGFFTSTDATQLAALYTSLGSGSVAYSLTDITPGDNYFDFTQGVDGSFTGIGSPPVITPPSGVPEPSTWALMLAGVGGIGLMLRRARKTMSFQFKDAFSA